MKVLFNIFLFSLNIINLYCNIVINENTNIIVIADIHGDIIRFKNILMNNNVINKNGNFILQKNSIVIQLGDQIDPKNDDIEDMKRKHFEVVYYSYYLEQEAFKHDSRFISLIGNHELINVEKLKEKPDLCNIISQRYIVKRIGKYLFCHGILKKKHIDILNYYNKKLDDINSIWYKYINDIYLDDVETIILNKLILDTDDSILFSKRIDTKDNNIILMKELNLDYIFIGHVKVDNIYTINNIWFLDLYLKKTFFKRIYNNIIIKNNTIYITPLRTELYI